MQTTGQDVSKEADGASVASVPASRVVRPMKGKEVLKAMPQVLRDTMKVSGVRVENAAKKSGLDSQYIDDVLEGKAEIDLERFIDLAQGMDYTPGGLLNRVIKESVNG